jgi:tetratricopeptide (TPR) repeat protein
MNRLGKQIAVFSMVWVILVMIVSQVYDNVTGRGLPAPQPTPPTVPAGTPGPDEAVTRLAELQSCVAADPENLDCTSDLADMYYAAKQWAQAQVNYERAVTLAPHDTSLLVKLAGTYIYQENFEQAVPTLQQAASLKTDSPEIHLLLGLSLSRLTPPRTEAALAEWQKVLEVAPGTAWAEQASQYISQTKK